MRTHAPVTIHANILAWAGFEEKARAIEEAVAAHADTVSVIYSVPENGPSVPDHWVTVPFECFFGCKFKTALEIHPGGVMLQIQADAHTDDWPGLVAKCREAFSSSSDLGVWGPSVDYSMYHPVSKVFIADYQPEKSLVSVRQTDGIVWALDERVIERMRQADYSGNRLGWGIDGMAIAYAYSHNLLVLRDLSVHVSHPKGAGYGREEAAKQLEWFRQQLTPQENIQWKITRIPQNKPKTRDLVYLLGRRLLGLDR